MPALFRHGLICRQISFAQPPVEQFKHQTQALISQSRIVARAFVTEKRMRAIHLVPGEARANFLQAGFDQISSLERDVRILPT